MRKRLVALLMGIIIGILSPVKTMAVTSEQRVSLDPSTVEIVDVSVKEEEETEVRQVEVYQDIVISTAEEFAQLAANCQLDT